MLMVVPRYEYPYNRRWFDIPASELIQDEEIYVLDTDDLTVERVSWEYLFDACRNKGIKFYNIECYYSDVWNTEIIAFDNNLVDFLTIPDIIDSIECLDGQVVITPYKLRNVKLTVSGVKYLFDLRRTDYDYASGTESFDFRVNRKKIFSIELSALSSVTWGISYLFKLNDYLVVKFLLVSDVTRATNVLTIVLSLKGELIDIFGREDDIFKGVDFPSKDKTFRAKYLMTRKGGI